MFLLRFCNRPKGLLQFAGQSRALLAGPWPWRGRPSRPLLGQTTGGFTRAVFALRGNARCHITHRLPPRPTQAVGTSQAANAAGSTCTHRSRSKSGIRASWEHKAPLATQAVSTSHAANTNCGRTQKAALASCFLVLLFETLLGIPSHAVRCFSTASAASRQFPGATSSCRGKLP